ncbi:hypothetical protein CEXT_223691 [Caerostris extrusa]|uniref:Uncharacterized protein n=1 Tax=Caerostris extrusa TaxID=172846 RepID=A0AAV4XTL2_CAEEX|nr:hypothetical protein CEXT_223691 [Caerostris extrusa]
MVLDQGHGERKESVEIRRCFEHQIELLSPRRKEKCLFGDLSVETDTDFSFDEDTHKIIPIDCQESNYAVTSSWLKCKFLGKKKTELDTERKLCKLMKITGLENEFVQSLLTDLPLFAEQVRNFCICPNKNCSNNDLYSCNF